MAISTQQLTIYLYSAHRAVIFAIAQLSCIPYRELMTTLDFGTDRHNKNLKNALSTASLGRNNSVNFGPLTQSYRR